MDDIARNFRPKTPTEQRIEATHPGETAEAVIRRLYLDDGLTQAEIAERLGVHRTWVIDFMARSRIPARDLRALTEPAPVPQEATS